VTRELTQRQLNRALLARQMLLDRADTTVPKALERMGSLQAQYAPAMYLGLWSRLGKFERADLTRALEQRKVVQGTLQRSTIHLVSARDYWPFALAVREERRRWWLAAPQHTATAKEIGALAKKVRARLKQDGAFDRKELGALVGSADRVNGVMLWLDIVRVPPSGTWEKRAASLFAAAEDWLGPPPSSLDSAKATVHVVTRYLEGYGPATIAEIANWAGLKPAAIAAALARMKTLTFRAEDGAELFDLPDAPRPDPDAVEVPVRFLPVWDATLLAHARRAEVIKEADRPRIFNSKTPHSLNTVLVDGQAAGTWTYAKGRIDVAPFPGAKLPKAVEQEAERLAVFHG